jgi:hypothetical protein
MGRDFIFRYHHVFPTEKKYIELQYFNYHWSLGKNSSSDIKTITAIILKILNQDIPLLQS